MTHYQIEEEIRVAERMLSEIRQMPECEVCEQFNVDFREEALLTQTEELEYWQCRLEEIEQEEAAMQDHWYGDPAFDTEQDYINYKFY